MRIRELFNAAVMDLLQSAAVAFAHGGRPGHIDEGPASPAWITITMVVAWIVIALSVVFVVLRLVRAGGGEKRRNDKQEKA